VEEGDVGMKRLDSIIIGLLLIWAVFIGSIAYATAAGASIDPPLSRQEKNARTWTPKIERKFERAITHAAGDDASFKVDAHCILADIEQDWSSPRAFTKAWKKNDRAVRRALSGITLDCVR
jgi:hypothetical protein